SPHCPDGHRCGVVPGHHGREHGRTAHRLAIRSPGRRGAVSTTNDTPATTPTGHRPLAAKQGNAVARERREKAVRVVLAVLMGIASIPLVLILFEVVRNGIGVISWEFFTRPEAPPSREGGGYAAGFVG